MNTWSVVFTKPRQEKLARENLERQGFVTYLPMLKHPKRLRGHWRDVIEPLFPRYLFIALEFGLQDLSPIRSTFGVLKLVRFGPEPATVPPGLIETLMTAEDPLTACHQPATERFKKGDRITIGAGPFAGVEAIFEAATAKGRVAVLLEILGRPTQVQVPKNDILYATDPTPRSKPADTGRPHHTARSETAYPCPPPARGLPARPPVPDVP